MADDVEALEVNVVDENAEEEEEGDFAVDVEILCMEVDREELEVGRSALNEVNFGRHEVLDEEKFFFCDA